MVVTEETVRPEILDVARLVNTASGRGELEDKGEALVFPHKPKCSPQADVYFVVLKPGYEGSGGLLDKFIKYLPPGRKLRGMLENPQKTREVVFRAVSKNSVDRHLVLNLGKFLETFDQYGIDKPIDVPVGAPFAVWFSSNPGACLQYARVFAGGKFGLNITALMAYEGNNIGIIEGTDWKEDGEGFLDQFHGDTREFKERLLGAVILVENYRLD